MIHRNGLPLTYNPRLPDLPVTVLMAAGKQLPKNVIGVLADCGFPTAREIMMQVIRQMGLPPALVYPFVKLGAKLYGGFDLDQFSALEAAAHIQVPVIFFHGEADDFVPCRMTEEAYKACTSEKEMYIVEDAGHAVSYLVNTPGYRKRVMDFLRKYMNKDI